MKLWLLRPNEARKGQGVSATDPWEPWYDCVFGLVVYAETEKRARTLVLKRQGAETLYTPGSIESTSPWLHPQVSTCVELTDQGDEGVVIIDLHSA